LGDIVRYERFFERGLEELIRCGGGGHASKLRWLLLAVNKGPGSRLTRWELEAEALTKWAQVWVTAAVFTGCASPFYLPCYQTESTSPKLGERGRLQQASAAGGYLGSSLSHPGGRRFEPG
jgi:hypothetical protein